MNKIELTFNNLQKALEDIGELLVKQYQDKLREDDAYATGNLVNNMERVIDIDNEEYVLSLQLEEYWKYVENGRKSGKFPPIDAIKRWIKVKPLLPREINGKLPQENQLAFLIARSIAENGIKPRPFLEETIEENTKWMLQTIEDALDKDIDDWITRTFEVTIR